MDQKIPPRKVLNKVRHACECCRSRKIRCDNFNPCHNCHRINIPCVYQAPKKKGPKRRETVEEIPRSIQNGFYIPECHNAASPTLSPALSVSAFQPSHLLSLETIQNCVDLFFTYKYPLMPILDREATYSSLHQLQNSPTQYGLIVSLCAVIMMQPEISISVEKDGTLNNSQKLDNMLAVDFLIKETYRARTYYDHVDNPSLASLQTSFFLFTCLSQLEKDNAAWVHLRESITMLQLLRLHEESTYSTNSDPSYLKYSRRTFWLLFVTEQAYALHRHRPLTLRRSINFPSSSEEEGEGDYETTIINGFLDSISLFRNFGDGFMTLWNDTESQGRTTTSSQPFILLQEYLKQAIPSVRERTEIQQADLLITKQWLKTIVWQLCLNKGMLSSNAVRDSMSFHYPIDIARDAILVTRFLPLKSFQANGIGILGKIFDIGCSLADVLLVHPHFLHTSTMEVGPKDYLMDLLRVLDMDIRGHSKYLGLLAGRVDECLGVSVPRTLEADGSSPALCEIDWDEGVMDSDGVYGSPVSFGSGDGWV